MQRLLQEFWRWGEVEIDRDKCVERSECKLDLELLVRMDERGAEKGDAAPSEGERYTHQIRIEEEAAGSRECCMQGHLSTHTF